MKLLRLIGITLLLISTSLLFACGVDDVSVEVPSMAEIEALMTDADYSAAQKLLETRLTADPDDAEAHFQIALVHFNQGSAGLAEEHFLRALALDPSRAPAVHHNLGVLAFSQNDIETAQREFMVALDLDPSDPDSHYQLGATYLMQAVPSDPASMELDLAKLDLAVYEFEAALTLEPGKPEPLVGMANIHLMYGDSAAAIAALHTALENRPEMREALFGLGRAYFMAGDFESATATLNQFLATNPPPEWSLEAQRILDDIAQ